MRKPLLSLLIVSCLGSVAPLAAGAAAVRKIDDTIINGDVVSINDGVVTVSPLPHPTTQPGQPTTQPVTIALSEIFQIVLRTPPVKSPAVAAAPAADADSSDQSPGVFSTIFGTFFGSGGPSPAAAPPAPTSQPAKALRWVAKLNDGDLLHGKIDHWADQKISIRLTGVNEQAVEFSTDHLAELWCDDDAACAKARALTLESGPEDIAFVRKDAEVISIKGEALGIDGDSLRFRYDEQDRKIALWKVVGLIPGAGSHPAAAKFHERIKLDSGDELSGTWTGADAQAFSLRTDWGAVLRLPRQNIFTVDFVNGRLVFLSDLTPAKVEQTPYFGRVIPWRADVALGGGPLVLSDGQYDRGIAMHSRCVLEYDIQGGFERFRAKVGFEQPGGARGRAVLRLLGDGKVLYENPDARGDQPPVNVDVDMTGAQRLTLEVDFGKVPEVGARVIWAEARLLRAKVGGE